MPPPEPPEGGSPNRPDSAICGKKFRAMLSCVEKTGAVNACTDKINDFLSCERHVFRTAVLKGPRQSTHATAHHLPPPPPPPRPTEEAPRRTAEHVGPYAVVKRVVEKQTKACEGLVEALRKPDYPTKVMEFGRRMMTDMRVTCEIVRSKSVQLWERAWKSISERDDNNPPPR